MAPLVAYAVAVVSTFFEYLGAAAFWAYVAAEVVVYGGLIGGMLAYSSSQQRKMRRALNAATNGIDTGRSLMVRDPVAARQVVYGQVLKSGSISFFEVGGSSNEYLYLHIDIADHEVYELGDVYFDKEVVPLDGSGNATGKYAGYVRVTKFLGSAAGERDLNEEAELPAIWTSDHLGKGVARLHVRLTNNPNLFSGGSYPLIEVLVKGKKCYDFRTAVTAWTKNAALITADFLMDTRFGKAIAQARIISADVIEAANVSDESIVLVDTSTEARYEINGVVNADNDPDASLAELESAMAGCVADPGGKWSIRAGAYRTPTLDFTDSDFAETSDVEITPRQSRQDTFNGVRGQYISPINQWTPGDFPVVKNDTYKGWDGGLRLWKDVVYNFTTSPAMAQRIAKIDLERGRQQIVVSADFKLKALQCQPGDVVTLTRSSTGWTTKPFEVVEWALKIVDKNGGPVLVVNLILRETASGVWDWADGAETEVDLAPNTDFWDASSVPQPAAPTLSTSNFQQVDGTISPRLRVQWPTPSDDHVTNGGKIYVEYKKHADADWIPWSVNKGTAVEDYVTDVLAGQSYDVRIQNENSAKVKGLFSNTATATVSTDVTAPGTPGDPTATGAPKSIGVSWPANGESDLGIYRVYRNTSNTFAGSSLVFSGKATSFVDHDVVVGTTYYYFVKAVDLTNNASAESNSANAAALDSLADIADGSITTVKIQDAAVSNISVAYTAGSVSTSHSGGGTDELQSVAITAEDAPINVAVCFHWVPLDNFTFTFDITRDDGGGPVSIYQVKQKSVIGDNTLAINFSDQPGAGAYTYALNVSYSGAFWQATPFDKRFLELTSLKK